MTRKVRVLGCLRGERRRKRGKKNCTLTGMSSVVREEKTRDAVEERVKK